MADAPQSAPIKLAETENFEAWMSVDDGEAVYHLETGRVSLHFFEEEWEELMTLMAQLIDVVADDGPAAPDHNA